MTKRIRWADTFRAVMIFFIAYGHTVPDGILKHYVYSFHVPAFLFLSGYLFKTEKERFFPFVWKKIKTLLIPYYIFALISIGIFVLLGDVAADGLDVQVNTGILPNILGMLYGSSANNRMKWNLPLWFLPCLFAAMVLAYPVSKLIRTLEKKKLRFAAPVLWVLTFLLPFLNFYLFQKRGLPYQLESAVYLMPFFIGGYLLRRIRFDEMPIKTPLRLLISALLIAAGGYIGVSLNEEIRYFSSLYRSLPLFYLSASLSVLGYLFLCPIIRIRAVDYVGQNTLCILLMHKFPIVFMRLVFKRVFEASELVMTAALLVTAVSIALCLIAGIVLNRFFPFMLGKFPARETVK